jgi:hypothetical protein
MQTVDEFRAELTEDVRQTVDLLREIITMAHDDLSERIKWNAPSFAINEEDLVTLGLERNGGVRVVLHRGAKQKDATDFRFDDPGGIARWPAADRGVITFKNRSAVERTREALHELCARWVRQVA